jgi:hypothetical protein
MASQPAATFKPGLPFCKGTAPGVEAGLGYGRINDRATPSNYSAAPTNTDARLGEEPAENEESALFQSKLQLFLFGKKKLMSASCSQVM